MSHIVKIQAKMTDVRAVERACVQLRLTPPRQGKHKVYTQDVEGLAINLPEWKYPIVVIPGTGELKYDNYNGSWGRKDHLDQFCQRYGVEAAKCLAEDRGLTYTETRVEADGSMVFEVNLEEDQQHVTVGGGLTPADSPSGGL